MNEDVRLDDKKQALRMMEKEDLITLYFGLDEAVKGLSKNNEAFIMAFRGQFDRIAELESENKKLLTIYHDYRDDSLKLKDAVEVLGKIAVLSQGGMFYDLADEALERFKK